MTAAVSPSTCSSSSSDFEVLSSKHTRSRQRTQSISQSPHLVGWQSPSGASMTPSKPRRQVWRRVDSPSDLLRSPQTPSSRVSQSAMPVLSLDGPVLTSEAKQDRKVTAILRKVEGPEVDWIIRNLKPLQATRTSAVCFHTAGDYALWGDGKNIVATRNGEKGEFLRDAVRESLARAKNKDVLIELLRDTHDIHCRV